MCGRTCLTLSPEEITHCCKYQPQKKHCYQLPEYRKEYNGGKQYQPSYNVAPTDVTPVLVSSAHFDETLPEDRVIVPMMWGIIPFWHTGTDLKHGLTTNNCRLETMLTSKLYKNTFLKGQRCVILSEGFYEWQTTKETKSSERDAYYFYMPQNPVKSEHSQDEKPKKNMNLLKMAGLFDIWYNANGDNIYSYTVVTFESDDRFSWLHHRSPAILETDQQVADWLDFKRVTDKEALATLRPASTLVWHRVSNIVNNSRNKSEQCNKPFEEVEKAKKSKPNMLESWLIKKKPKHDDDDQKV